MIFYAIMTSNIFQFVQISCTTLTLWFICFSFYLQLYLWPAPTRTGMKASRTVEIILHLAGFKNIKSKVHFWLLAMNWLVTFALFTSKTAHLPLRQVIGSRNPHNTVKAVFKALNAVMSFDFELFFFFFFRYSWICFINHL